MISVADVERPPVCVILRHHCIALSSILLLRSLGMWQAANGKACNVGHVQHFGQWTHPRKTIAYRLSTPLRCRTPHSMPAHHAGMRRTTASRQCRRTSPLACQPPSPQNSQRRCPTASQSTARRSRQTPEAAASQCWLKTAYVKNEGAVL